MFALVFRALSPSLRTLPIDQITLETQNSKRMIQNLEAPML